MNRKLLIVVGSLCLGATIVALAEPIRDWRELEDAHSATMEAIKNMDLARRANKYDSDGHAQKAEQLMLEAEKEIKYAEDSIKKAK